MSTIVVMSSSTVSLKASLGTDTSSMMLSTIFQGVIEVFEILSRTAHLIRDIQFDISSGTPARAKNLSFVVFDISLMLSHHCEIAPRFPLSC